MNMLARYIRLISKFFLRDNYIISAAAGLGFCSALAVTNKMENSLTMGVGVVFVTCVSFCLVYPFKKLIIASGTHHKITLLMIIISVFVTIFNLIVQATIPRIASQHKSIYRSDYDKLHCPCRNCRRTDIWILGCPEEDIKGMSRLLYRTHVFLALMREPLGFGTLLNFRILPESFPVVVLMITPVGGFFALALWRFMLRPLFVKTGVVYQENILQEKEEVTDVETPARKKSVLHLKCPGKLIIIIALGVLLVVSLVTNIKAVTSLNSQFQILLPIFLSALFFDGIVLSKLLGICPLLNKSRQVDAAWKMGLAVVIVVTLSTSLNWLVYNKILIGASNYLSSISPVPIRLEKIFYLTVFIVTIATFVQILGVLLRRFAMDTYQQMDNFWS